MRRLVVAVGVVAVMAATMVVSPTGVVIGPSTVEVGTASASAQVPGQPTYCGPWRQAWYVSESGYFYHWWWRWCYNPSIRGGWYVDWANWQWDGFAGPGFSPGFQYDTEPVQ